MIIKYAISPHQCISHQHKATWEKITVNDKVELTLVPWIMFRTPLGKPASIANSANVKQAPDQQKTILLV